MDDKEIEVILSPLDDIKAKAVKKAYKEMENSLALVDTEYNEIIEKDITQKVSGEARSLRLRISKVRTDGEKWKTKEKAQYNEAGKVIQTLYNKLRDETSKREEDLKTIELHFENLEIERIKKIKDARLKSLLPYDVDSSFVDLGNMTIEVWSKHFAGIKAAHQKAIDDEKKEKEDAKLDIVLETRKKLLMPYAQFSPFLDLYPETTEEEFNKILEEVVLLKKEFDDKQQKILDENVSLKKANTLLKEAIPEESNPFKSDSLFGPAEVKPAEVKEIFATRKEPTVNEMMGFEEPIPEPCPRNAHIPLTGREEITASAQFDNHLNTDKKLLMNASKTLETYLSRLESDIAKTALSSCINTLNGAAMILK